MGSRRCAPVFWQCECSVTWSSSVHTRQVLVTLQCSARSLDSSGAAVEVFARAPQQIRAKLISPNTLICCPFLGWTTLRLKTSLLLLFIFLG